MPATGLVLAALIGVTLGFFGGGGSILTVPLLVYVFALAPKEAIASSLVVVGVASAAATVQHGRAGHVEPRTALLFGGAGMAGAHLGGRAGAFLDGALLLLLFAAMMMMTAVAMWRGRRDAPATGVESGRREVVPLLGQGLAVGLLTGLVGAGGGFLIVPALVLWAGLSMPSAVGTSLLVITMNCVAGFLGYRSHVAIDAALVATVAAIAVGGSFVGSALARRVDPASLRRGFSAFVFAMAVLILVQETETWLRTARSALPSSVPQAIFAGAMLLLGVAAGRVSRGAPPRRPDPRFRHGAGI